MIVYLKADGSVKKIYPDTLTQGSSTGSIVLIAEGVSNYSTISVTAKLPVSGQVVEVGIMTPISAYTLDNEVVYAYYVNLTDSLTNFAGNLQLTFSVTNSGKTNSYIVTWAINPTLEPTLPTAPDTDWYANIKEAFAYLTGKINTDIPQDIADAVTNHNDNQNAHPYLLGLISALTNSVPQQISTHNSDQAAHPYILNLIKNIEQGGAGIGEIHKINLNTGEESVIYDTADGITVTGSGQIDYGDNQSVNIDTEYNLPIVAGDGVNIDADASGKQIIVKVDENVAKKDSNNNFSTAQTINGTLTINGDIVQNGETYETHAEQVYTKNDEIITRDGAVGGLASGALTGIKAKKYDGTNDGQLGFDANGVARVGDVDDTQPLLTRAESTDLTDGQPLVWDATNQRAIGGTTSEPIAGALRDNTVQIKGDNGTLKLGNANDIIGTASIAIGSGAEASGNYSLSLGRLSEASGSHSLAIAGNIGKAQANDCIQLGEGTNTTANTLQIYKDNIYNHSTHTLTVQNTQVNGTNVYGVLQGETAPTSTTVGAEGQFYLDKSKTPADLYLCTKVETVGGVKVYTWEKQGGGSGESIYDANGNAYINSTNDGLKVYSAKDSSNNYGTTISAGNTSNIVGLSVDSENTQTSQRQVYSDSGITYTITNQNTTAQTGITKTAKIQITQDTTTTETYKETTVSPEGVVEEYVTKDGSGVGVVAMGDTGSVQCLGNSGGKIGLQASGDKGRILSGDYTNKKLEVKFENASGDSVVKEVAFTDDLNTKLDKTGGTISGNLAVQGNLTVTGETTTEKQKTLEVEDNFIYTNANKVELTALLSGIAIYKNGTDIYAIAYDPATDSVKLGLGTRDAQGIFHFNTGEGSPVAVRADSANLTNNHIIIWDATNHKFIDSGKTVTDLENKNIGVELNVPNAATNGTLTESQLQILQSSNSNYIILDHEIYKISGSGHREGYLTYNCNEYENSAATNKFITITISTRSWVLNTVPLFSQQQIIDLIYPVGSVYISVDSICPETKFGGTWEIFPQNYCLQTAERQDMDLNNFITFSAGLPGITGSIQTRQYGASETPALFIPSGAFGMQVTGGTETYSTTFESHSRNAKTSLITFDASQGGTDPIYGKSTTVQPKAIAVAVWKRTA